VGTRPRPGADAGRALLAAVVVGPARRADRPAAGGDRLWLLVGVDLAGAPAGRCAGLLARTEGRRRAVGAAQGACGQRADVVDRGAEAVGDRGEQRLADAVGLVALGVEVEARAAGGDDRHAGVVGEGLLADVARARRGRAELRAGEVLLRDRLGERVLADVEQPRRISGVGGGDGAAGRLGHRAGGERGAEVEVRVAVVEPVLVLLHEDRQAEVAGLVTGERGEDEGDRALGLGQGSVVAGQAEQDRDAGAALGGRRDEPARRRPDDDDAARVRNRAGRRRRRCRSRGRRRRSA